MSDRKPTNNQLSQDLPGPTAYLTGHDQNTGKAIVHSRRPVDWAKYDEDKLAMSVAYTTSFPADLNSDADVAAHDEKVKTGKLGLVSGGGTVLRYVDFAPGYTCMMHRTRSVDYGIVLEGSIESVLDSGEVQLMGRGDVMVQRATMHAWRNPSEREWARMIFCLQDCQPLFVKGERFGEDLGRGTEGVPPSGNDALYCFLDHHNPQASALRTRQPSTTRCDSKINPAIERLKRPPEPPDEEDWDVMRIAKKYRTIDHTKDIVKIIVGKGESAAEYFVHRTRLAEHSKYFGTAHSPAWYNQKKSTIEQPDDDPYLFGAFKDFIYYGKLDVEDDGDITCEEEEDVVEACIVEDLEFDKLIALYQLGDKLMSQTFKDAVVDRITWKVYHIGFFPLDFHEKVYCATTTVNGLRRLAVDMAIYLLQEELAEAKMDERWNEYFKNVAVRANSGEAAPDTHEPFREVGCKYHDHGEEECC